MSESFRALIIGDKFIPTDSYAEYLNGSGIPTSYVDWEGTKAEQHALQQVTEFKGVNAVEAPTALLDAVHDVEALGLHFAPVTAELIGKAPNLKLIAVARTGLENIDLEEATRRGIGVVPALGRNAGAVAELAIGLMLSEARNIARADASVKAGGWRKDFPGARIEIAGRKIGMVGFGHVGRITSERLAGFKPDILTFDPYASDELLNECGVRRVDTWTTCSAKATLSWSRPASPLKPSASSVNTSSVS
jgi:D-3-phosphoglycerate dehydrogenase